MSDDVPLGTLIGFLFVLLFLSAFFSGTETALMRLNRFRLRHLARAGHRGAVIADKLMQRPDRLISLILLGNNLVNFLAAGLVAIVTERAGGPLAAMAGTFTLTIVVLIFAEVTPKTLAALHPEKVALPAVFIYYPLMMLALPLVMLTSFITKIILRLFGVRTEDVVEDHVTIDELRTLVDESGGLLPQRRHKMLMGILDLEQISVDDIMVPHNEIVGIDLADDWDDVLETIRSSSFTRLPVYRDSIDNVVGMLHMKRLVQRGALEGLTRERLESLVAEPYFVPEGTPLHRQLVQFQRNRKRSAFVVDEYGDIQGLVTLEDILEEIVGEFTSEPSPAHADVKPDAESDGYLVNASANVRALNRMMSWHLPTDGPKTLNGLILEQLEKIPKTGTGLMLSDYPIEIVQVTENVVKTVRIQAPVSQKSAAVG